MISLHSTVENSKNTVLPSEENQSDGSNLFGASLGSGSMMKSKKVQYLEEKNKKKALLTIGVSTLALLTYSIFFFYGNVIAYLQAPRQIAKLQGEIGNYEDVLLPSLEKTKDLHKAAYDQEFEEVIASLETVFPEKVDKLGIVRLFESFAVEVAATFPPFEFTSINFSAPQKKENYTITPVSTSIHSSLAGFDRFLSLVDHSGYIYTGEGNDREFIDKKVRLMSISNISVKYRGVDEQTGKDQGVDFTVKLNLYSR